MRSTYRKHHQKVAELAAAHEVEARPREEDASSAEGGHRVKRRRIEEDEVDQGDNGDDRPEPGENNWWGPIVEEEDWMGPELDENNWMGPDVEQNEVNGPSNEANSGFLIEAWRTTELQISQVGLIPHRALPPWRIPIPLQSRGACQLHMWPGRRNTQTHPPPMPALDPMVGASP